MMWGKVVFIYSQKFSCVKTNTQQSKYYGELRAYWKKTFIATVDTYVIFINLQKVIE